MVAGAFCWGDWLGYEDEPLGATQALGALVIDVTTLRLAVHLGAVGPLKLGVGFRVFFSVGLLGAGSSQEQDRAGSQQQGEGAQTFHAAKVRLPDH